MPVIYYQSAAKIAWRAEMVQYCREAFGLERIPEGRQYWALASEQPAVPGAEVVQLTDLGFLRPEQFHGVDRHRAIIARNRAAHPDAHWHCGEWIEVVRRVDFHPAVINLDTTHYAAGRPCWDIVSETMYLCPPGTILLANVMLNNPRGKSYFRHNDLIDGLCRMLPSADRGAWLDSGRHYVYPDGRSLMGSYLFRREDR